MEELQTLKFQETIYFLQFSTFSFNFSFAGVMQRKRRPANVVASENTTTNSTTTPVQPSTPNLSTVPTYGSVDTITPYNTND